VSKGPPLVLVAHDDAAFRGRIQKALQSFGCKVEAVRDGEQAFRYAVTHHPSLMVLQPRLAKLSGLAVCEGVKGSPDLKATRVALVGQAGWQQTIDRRAAALGYADDRFDANAPAAELVRRLGRLLGRDGAAPDHAAAPPAPKARAGEHPAAQQGVKDSGGSGPLDPRAEIRRLARIMLSDLKIYNPDLFQKSLAEGRFLDVFKDELGRGKELIAHRFPHLPERLTILAAALREGLDEERAAAR